MVICRCAIEFVKHMSRHSQKNLPSEILIFSVCCQETRIVVIFFFLIHDEIYSVSSSCTQT